MKPQRLDLTYCIDWDSPWHVGSGYASAAADRLIRRFGGAGGPPFVPGSLIKGIVRNHCERLALALGLDAIDPHATGAEQNARLVEHFKLLEDSSLIVDRLFGTRFQGECLFVDNAEPVNAKPAADGADEDAANSSLRTRTAMDRITGTVIEGHLFTTEMADPLSLEGRLRARHPAGVLTQDDGGFPFEYALLLAALRAIDALGGNKSAGLGRCRFSIREKSLRWNGEERDIEEALDSFAEHYDESRNTDEWAEMVQMIREENAT